MGWLAAALWMLPVAAATAPAAPAALQAPLDPVARAEADRLLEEMRARSAAQQWQAVERAYRQLHALGVTVPFEAHVLAAHAAQARGDAEGAVLRLEAALAVRQDPAVRAWLDELREGYGRVVLEVGGRGGVALVALDPPLQPDRRAAIQAASLHLEQAGSFSGLLPVGHYRLGDHTFEVTPGLTVRLSLSAREVRRARRAARRAAEPGAGSP